MEFRLEFDRTPVTRLHSTRILVVDDVAADVVATDVVAVVGYVRNGKYGSFQVLSRTSFRIKHVFFAFDSPRDTRFESERLAFGVVVVVVKTKRLDSGAVRVACAQTFRRAGGLKEGWRKKYSR